MRKIVPFVFSLFMLLGCSESLPYFKITFTDELNSEGFFAEPIEVNNLGKVIYKTHIHNENDNLYQNLFFGELSDAQLDSVVMFLGQIKHYPLNVDFDTNQVAYKMNITIMTDAEKVSHVIMGNEFDDELSEFIEYLKHLPAATKRYSLKGNYFFETGNICLGEQ